MRSKVPLTVKIPPQGKRTKPILISAEFLENEKISLEKEQNKAIAKHLQGWGMNNDLNTGSQG